MNAGREHAAGADVAGGDPVAVAALKDGVAADVAGEMAVGFGTSVDPDAALGTGADVTVELIVAPGDAVDVGAATRVGVDS